DSGILEPPIPPAVNISFTYLLQVAAAATSIDVWLTSNNSSTGIGAGLPSRIAETNAAAQPFCPLSCRNSRCRLNPVQPNACNTRKLSICRMQSEEKTSMRSLGNDL